MAEPVVAIGVALHERAEYLGPALDSLLAQTYRSFGLMLVDDCSGDATPEIAERYAAADERVELRRNPRRLGLAGAWQAAFAHARERWPEARYFAWGSDHDLWDEEWLATLVAELDAHPEAVLAYPQSVRISASGEPGRESRLFETAGVRSPFLRFVKTAGGLSAGNMIYGLFRVEALERVGPFPALVGPDRLLLTRLSLLGEFRQVPRVLWQRRFDEPARAPRQRAALFPGRRPPLHAYVPWWAVHVAVLVWRLGIRGEGQPEVGRAAGLAAAAWYALRVGAHVAVSQSRRKAGRLRRLLLGNRRPDCV